MVRLSKIIEELELIAPSEAKCSWDNVGLLVGDESQRISRVFVCLDITSENVKSAVDFGADLIISHHPLIFEPLKNITESTVTGSIVRTLVKHNISAFCMHTNFDVADGGMNDLLAAKLGLENVRKFTPDECMGECGEVLDGIGRVGVLERPMPLSDFLLHIKSVLGSKALKYAGNLNETVQTVALCSGSGGTEMYAAYHSGADVYVTADLKHDHGRIAEEIGLNIIDAGHFETENIICDFLSEFFLHRFPQLEVVTSFAKPYFKSI
ncbi:MAG: Nif3-like dinuclear metal center hexameric protein [Clostridia bacterium]|nr:Nif3-like dinuclear metal center hexameric protein [Clostridia bacterium]